MIRLTLLVNQINKFFLTCMQFLHNRLIVAILQQGHMPENPTKQIFDLQ